MVLTEGIQWYLTFLPGPPWQHGCRAPGYEQSGRALCDSKVTTLRSYVSVVLSPPRMIPLQTCWISLPAVCQSRVATVSHGRSSQTSRGLCGCQFLLTQKLASQASVCCLLWGSHTRPQAAVCYLIWPHSHLWKEELSCLVHFFIDEETGQ